MKKVYETPAVEQLIQLEGICVQITVSQFDDVEMDED